MSHILYLADCFRELLFIFFFCPLNRQKLGGRGLDLVFKTRILYCYCCVLFFYHITLWTHNIRLSHFQKRSGRLKLATCSLSHLPGRNGSSFHPWIWVDSCALLGQLQPRIRQGWQNSKISYIQGSLPLSLSPPLLFLFSSHCRETFLWIFSLSFHCFLMKTEIGMYIHVYLYVPFFLTLKGSTPQLVYYT